MGSDSIYRKILNVVYICSYREEMESDPISFVNPLLITFALGVAFMFSMLKSERYRVFTLHATQAGINLSASRSGACLVIS